MTGTRADHVSWLQLNHLHLRLLEFLFYFQILFYFHVCKILSVKKKDILTHKKTSALLAESATLFR